jgi:predicted metal-dependent hydrolase
MPQQLGLLRDDKSALLDPFDDGLIVRRSRRARHLILQVVPPHTLEIVVPYGTRPKEVEAFVREHRQWIERARVDISRRFKGERSARPAEIRLAAVNLAFPVTYEHRPSSRPSLSALSGGLRIVVPDEAYTVTAILRRWLLEQAALHLKPWLRREAVRLGLQPRRITVRLQRTRWGSCSSQGNLNLNASLLFLRPEVVRYLLVHELCHLRWLNHSRRYWALVRQAEPDYLALDAELADAWTYLPWWAIQAARPARGVV